MQEPKEEPTAAAEPRPPREYRFTGLADLLPDWILPPEGKQHVRNARKELLMAARSILDAAIERQERGTVIRRTPSRIEIE
ncbi:MAG TPA: hypothetical protein VEQ11_08580 [Chloroflexota bacterium]|nr:hypothetical protein [Chloroflexota bacterium]